MLKNFNFTVPKLTDTKTLVRIGLGVLLAANIVAAIFAFHIIGESPEGITGELVLSRNQLVAAQARLNRGKTLSGRIDKGRGETVTFLDNYLTTRRHTYSTIISEITTTAKSAGMTMKEATISPLDAIEGSDDLDMMTITVNFEGNYGQLVKFVNLLDRSPRFLIIESLQVAPQPKGDILTVGLKLNTFIREEPGDQPAPARSGM